MTWDITGISGLDDTGQARLVLYASGRMVHAPFSIISQDYVSAITGTANEITVEDGDSTNPTIGLPDDVEVSATITVPEVHTDDIRFNDGTGIIHLDSATPLEIRKFNDDLVARFNEDQSVSLSGDVTIAGGLSFGNFGTGAGDVGININESFGRMQAAADNAPLILNRSTADNNDRVVLNFFRNGSSPGDISATNSTTSYNTSSDSRLKENHRDFDAGAIIDQIEVTKYERVENGNTEHGVVAQALHLIYPEAVRLGEGEPGEEGFVPWGVDYSKLVAPLMKEVRELRKRVAELEGGN